MLRCGPLSLSLPYNVSLLNVVQKFAEHTYRCPLYPKPNLWILDANCVFSKHVKNRPWWNDIGMPVDVFHHKSKHKVTDTWCQTRCNPAAFKELRYFNEKTKNEEWYFNTSVAEQTNVWVGGFHSMCREMRAVFYDFFLDQMVLLRNEMTRRRLVQRGRNPTYFRKM
jgi:hypothetical protein